MERGRQRRRLFSASIQAVVILALFWPAASEAQVNVLSNHYDSGRTGANLSETVLTAGNVNAAQFGKLYRYPVDGSVYAQPLYVSGVRINNIPRNVLYVATMNDKVYAFDADSSSPTPLWTRDLTSPPSVTPVPITDIVAANLNIVGNVGIESTPVIDAVAGTIYLVARTKESGAYVQKLHALDIATGGERPNSPVTITASVPGSAPDAIGGVVTFDPKMQNQRPALVLSKGVVLISWASHQDATPYHGWVIGYNASTLAQSGVFCVTPDVYFGGIWHSGRAPAIDGAGNVYFVTGNAIWDGTRNFGDSVLKFGVSTSGLSLTDFFTPSNWSTLNNNDADLGSTGPMLIPNSNVLVIGGKDGVLYLVNAANLGHEAANDPQIIQRLTQTAGMLKGGPAYWNSATAGPLVYYWAQSDVLTAFHFNGTKLDTMPYASGAAVSPGSPGGALTISANGSQTGSGIVWASLSASQSGNLGLVAGIVRAYNAETLQEIWNSEQNSTRDRIGTLVKFVPPVVANGKVFQPNYDGEVVVYGLLAASAPDLTVLKTHTGNFARSQTGATYTITARNVGSTATSGMVSVQDTLPPGLTATAISGTNWSCTLNTLVCSRTDALAAGASYPAITVTVNVASNASASVTNTAAVSGGGETNTTNNTVNDVTTVSGGVSGGIVHVGGTSGHPVVTNRVMTINYTPVASNDALVVLVGCRTQGVTGISLSAPGWTFTPISGLVGPSGFFDYISTFGAITPNTAPVTLTVTFGGNVGDCSNNDTTMLIDEFSGNDTTGGTTTFDAHNESLDPAAVTCTGAPVTPANNNGAIWYGCFDNVTGVTGGYTKGQDDGIGDWSSYKTISGQQGVAQNPGFVTNPSFFSFALAGVSIKAGSSVPAPDLTITKSHSGNFTLGQTAATYAITVRNVGNGPTSGPVTMTDTLPAGLTATAIGGTNWTCTLATLVCTRNDALAAGSSYPVITVTVNVAANAPASITNRAVASGGGDTNTANNSASDVTNITTGAPAKITLIQSRVNGSEPSVSTMSATFQSNNTAGNVLIVTGTAARPAGTLTISDTLGNTYIPAIGPVTDAAQEVSAYIWYVPSSKAGPNTVTITPTSSRALEIHISEWSGIASTSPVDQVASDVGTGTTASSGARTTTANGELIFGYTFLANTATAGTGFTGISLVNGDLDEYQIQTTAGSVAATFSQATGTWFTLMATFRPTGSQVNVPSVVNLTQSAATTAITNVGLVIGTITTASSATVPAGSVISQNPAAGTSVAPGSAVSLVVSTGSSAGLAVDNVLSSDGLGTRTLTGFNTSIPGELLLAFVGADGPSGGGQTATLSGASLTWTLVRRVNTQNGTSEIWKATAAGVLSNATITSTLSSASHRQSLTVVAFSGASGTGATGGGSATTGAPSVSLVTTQPGSFVYGVGNDWDHATARTLGSGQAMVHQWVDSTTGDTYWVQNRTAPIAAAGSTASLNDTAPTSDRWNLASVEVLMAPTAVPSVVNLTQSAATAAITNAGLVLGTITTASSATVPSGSVISQNPTAGTSVVSGSAVNLVVSTGSQLVVVPSVVNLTQAAATTAITNAGLVVGTITTASSASVPSGSVISQNPVSGTSAAVGSAVSLVVSTGPAAAGISVDATVFSDGAGTRTAVVTTTGTNRRLLAFGASDGSSLGGQTLTVSGGGLSWTLVRRVNTRLGTSEIWQALAATALSSANITLTQSQTGYRQSLTVVAFAGASGVGASTTANGASGAPTVSLTTTQAGSLVYGVGNDFDGAVARTVPAGQSKVHEWVDTATGDTYWVQARVGAVSAAGTAVTLNDTSPTNDRWNFAIVEIVR